MPVVNTNIAETINITQNGQVDVARYTTANVNVQAGGKYHLLDRVKDDSNNDIGCVVGFVESNNVEYAVVCLDKLSGSGPLAFMGSDVQITDVVSRTHREAYTTEDLATTICDKVLAQAATSGTTAPAVTYCRSKSFVIDGVTYYGQVPTLYELISLLSYCPSVVNKTSHSWSCTFYSNSPSDRKLWYYYAFGSISQTTITVSNAYGSDFYVYPILEIPIQ